MIADAEMRTSEIRPGLIVDPELQLSVLQQKVPDVPTLASVHDEAQPFV